MDGRLANQSFVHKAPAKVWGLCMQRQPASVLRVQGGCYLWVLTAGVGPAACTNATTMLQVVDDVRSQRADAAKRLEALQEKVHQMQALL